MHPICRPAQPGDVAIILTLTQAFATSFVVDAHARQVVAEQEQQVIGCLLGFV